ncbi:MAG: hypothetical protein IT334_02325 [Thermomicrobiales bacterium]|nr:hypothetical protein [Thermomicrobiales bacterium]
MTIGHALTHELANDLQKERNEACTEASNDSLTPGVAAMVRRAIGARMITLGERLSGSNAMVSAGAQ